jgi:hypothetical protein
MANHPSDNNWVPACFFENQRNFPREQLLKYAGKHIAWSWDGTHIVASADSGGELWGKVQALGLEPSRVVYSYVDEPNVSLAGTACISPTDKNG